MNRLHKMAIQKVLGNGWKIVEEAETYVNIGKDNVSLTIHITVSSDPITGFYHIVKVGNNFTYKFYFWSQMIIFLMIGSGESFSDPNGLFIEAMR